VTTIQRVIPQPDAALNDLFPILVNCCEALELGTFEGRDYFGQRKEQIEPLLFAHIARYTALQVLKERIATGKDENGHCEWELKNLANSGIYLAYRQYRVRALKFKREVLYPGRSQSRQRFYEQEIEQMQIDFPDYDYSQDYINLLLLWRVDDDHALKSFYLACPYGATRSSVKLLWNKMVPIEYLQNALVVSSPESSIPPEDLPIEEDIEIEIERDLE